MKKNFVYLLSLSALVVGLVSCGGSKKSQEEAANEEAAVIAGSATKSLLTEELKFEAVQFLKDMPESDLPYRIKSGEVSIGVGDMSYMLPVSKAAELNTLAQKARACGIYFADYNILKATGQPVSEVEGVLVKLTSDLNISFVQNILKEEAPADASKDEFKVFMKNQEDKLIDAMAANDKMDIQLELLGGMAAEYACLMANPSLVVKGDATSAGLTENMERRLEMLGEITADLSVYYSDLNDMKEIITPLKDMVTTVSTARTNNAEILAIRDTLIK